MFDPSSDRRHEPMRRPDFIGEHHWQRILRGLPSAFTRFEDAWAFSAGDARFTEDALRSGRVMDAATFVQRSPEWRGVLQEASPFVLYETCDRAFEHPVYLGRKFYAGPPNEPGLWGYDVTLLPPAAVMEVARATLLRHQFSRQWLEHADSLGDGAPAAKLYESDLSVSSDDEDWDAGLGALGGGGWLFPDGYEGRTADGARGEHDGEAPDNGDQAAGPGVTPAAADAAQGGGIEAQLLEALQGRGWAQGGGDARAESTPSPQLSQRAADSA